MAKNSKKRLVVRFKSKQTRANKSPVKGGGSGGGESGSGMVGGGGGSDDMMNSARLKLKGALQELMPHSDDDSTSEEDNSHTWSNAIKRAGREVGNRRSTPGGGEGFKNSFIMKLFDRTVDLSSYTESTPLYPICRAWIANSSLYSPFNRKVEEMKEEVKREDEDGEGVTRLPSPMRHLDSEEGFKLRVPQPLLYRSQLPHPVSLDEMGSDWEGAPGRDELLADNLAHWSKVRQSWREASRINEQRYAPSINILTDMFNNAQKSF